MAQCLNLSQRVVKTFIAHKADDEIVLEGKTAEESPVKWIFSEIPPTVQMALGRDPRQRKVLLFF